MPLLFHIPKIYLKTLSKKERDIYHNLDTQPYGKDIALLVAKKLLLGKGLFHAHRDYCGMGMFFFENSFTLGLVYDGYDAPFQLVVTCINQNDFVAWLSKENNQSMSLYGEKFNNQTISKIRLEWFLEDNYSPGWNDYCQYVRERYS